MKKHLTFKKIAITLLILLVVAQLFRIDKSTKPADPAKDFIVLSGANENIAATLKTACYDCHSNEPVYPWYTSIAPVSWWIKHHINEGSHHLNFSEWGNYSSKKKDHKLEECVEMMEEDEMPLSSYTWMHHEAKLDEKARKELAEWFRSLRTYESGDNK